MKNNRAQDYDEGWNDYKAIHQNELLKLEKANEILKNTVARLQEDNRTLSVLWLDSLNDRDNFRTRLYKESYKNIYVCKICKCLWHWSPLDGSYSLLNEKQMAGKCCDNMPMERQITPLSEALAMGIKK